MLPQRPLVALVWLSLLAGTLVGCGAATPQTPAAQSGPTATLGQPTQPVVTAAPAVVANTTPSPDTSPQAATASVPTTVTTALPTTLAVASETVAPEMIKTLVAQLAQQISVDPAKITLVSAEAVQWPDGSLGCPKPDRMYPQVITSGFRVLFAVAPEGKTYAFHGDAQSRFSYCGNPAK